MPRPAARSQAAKPRPGGETCQVNAGAAGEGRVIISGVVKVQTAGQLARGRARSLIQAAGRIRGPVAGA